MENLISPLRNQGSYRLTVLLPVRLSLEPMNVQDYGRIVRYRVLGPLGVTAQEVDLPFGGRQQRLVLALLIAANGRAASPPDS